MHSFTYLFNSSLLSTCIPGGAAEQKNLPSWSCLEQFRVKTEHHKSDDFKERGTEVWEPLTEGRAKLA